MDSSDEITAKFLLENQVTLDGERLLIKGKRTAFPSGRVLRYDTSWKRTEAREKPAEVPLEAKTVEAVIPAVKETTHVIVSSCSRCNSLSREVKHALAYMFL